LVDGFNISNRNLLLISTHSPPGTGKTKTILALIGFFLSNRPPPAKGVLRKKILLCAPSNAAVDEVAKRLKEGVRDSKGQIWTPKVVRIGADMSINVSVKDISFDELVDRALDPQGNLVKEGTSNAMIELRAKINEIKSKQRSKTEERNSIKDNPESYNKLNEEIRQFQNQLNDLYVRIDSTRDKLKQQNKALDLARRKIGRQILQESDVICSTLSGAGIDYLNNADLDFEAVVIDEAAQAIELSSLIPLRHGCLKCILVGGEWSIFRETLSGPTSSSRD
jgi:senataxin